MLTPLQALLSAVLTGLIVQYLSSKFELREELDDKIKNLKIILPDRKIPKTLLFPTSSPEDEPPLEVNKLLDAIFVSHGIQAEEADNSKLLPERREIIIIDESNFLSVYTGDWLILAHVPWYPSSKEYLDHFIAEFASIPGAPLNLAILDCHSHPFLAAALNVRQYPSLHLVTQSGRLREWPFELRPIDQETLRFIVNGQWKYLPVYQLLISIHDKKQLFLSFIQIKVFNLFSSSTMELQPKIFNWIINNRPLTSGILGGLSLATLFLSHKLNHHQ